MNPSRPRCRDRHPCRAGDARLGRSTSRRSGDDLPVPLFLAPTSTNSALPLGAREFREALRLRHPEGLRKAPAAPSACRPVDSPSRPPSRTRTALGLASSGRACRPICRSRGLGPSSSPVRPALGRSGASRNRSKSTGLPLASCSTVRGPLEASPAFDNDIQALAFKPILREPETFSAVTLIAAVANGLRRIITGPAGEGPRRRPACRRFSVGSVIANNSIITLATECRLRTISRSMTLNGGILRSLPDKQTQEPTVEPALL